jgi:diguanylate cyclase (GGDEF)-like protein/PAS domain S-box-containing protein
MADTTTPSTAAGTLPGTGLPRPAPWPWQRVHQALMPDYNRKATAYWWLVAALGAGVLGWAFLAVAALPLASRWQVATGVLVAMLAGAFPVRVRHSKNSFAAGEVFIFLLLLIHGPAAAVLAAGAEVAVGALRTSKRWTSRIISPAMAALAMASAGWALQAVLARVGMAAGSLITTSMVFALAYFVINTVLVTSVFRMKRNERLVAADVFSVFGWVGIAYAGSACVAALLYLVYRQSGTGVLVATVPLLGMMLATLHYFFRQQEASEAVRRAGAEALEREQELAKKHVAELQASERRFHSAFTHASIGMALLAYDGKVLQANQALCTLLGWPAQELVGLAFTQLVCDNHREPLRQQLAGVNSPGFVGFALDLQCHHKSAQAATPSVWVATHCSPFSEAGASLPCLILQVQDISARRSAEEGLHHLAFHDSLTGLPNRRRFHQLLTDAVEQEQAVAEQTQPQPQPQPQVDRPSTGYAVMFLDFDRFKLINDSLGHSAGDEFLVQVAQRIGACLRPCDTVARLGGDEFAVLARQVHSQGQVTLLADRLLLAIRQPFEVAGTELSTSASIGITFSALGYSSPEDVLRDADTAMYKAKAAGKARYALFDASLHTEVAQRLRLEGDLRHAIDAGQLSVVYQPVYGLQPLANAENEDLQTALPLTPLGFEALVRWQHPQDGLIDPGTFLPIAEEAGLMVKLTDFVLHCACRQLAQWQQLAPAYQQLTMNVNVASHDLAHPALVSRVGRAVQEAGIAPQHLCLELTENILMSRLEGALPMLSELRSSGVVLAIDDFGTGYSSLSHLSSLPIDCLKIDRGFVTHLHPGSKEATVVRAIVLLGQSLGKTVVAEGIETAAQLQQLQQMGCAMGQGYLLAKPQSAGAVTALLVAPLRANQAAEKAAEKAAGQTRQKQPPPSALVLAGAQHRHVGEKERQAVVL